MSAMRPWRRGVTLLVGGIILAVALPARATAGVPTIDFATNASAFARLGAEWMAMMGDLTKWRTALTDKLSRSYAALDEAGAMRRAIEANQYGQLSGFGKRIRSNLDFRTAVDTTGAYVPEVEEVPGVENLPTDSMPGDSLPGGWRARVNQLRSRYMIALSTGYAVRRDPSAYLLFRSALPPGCCWAMSWTRRLARGKTMTRRLPMAT